MLTGTESTGKSALAEHLAERYHALWTPEAARRYAEALGGSAALRYEDVERIARLHVAAAEEAERRARRLLILDTDLVSTLVYSRHYYGRCPAWIEREARARLADLYLLCHPDLPWQPDPARDRPDSREQIHELFRRTLDAFHARRADVRGDSRERETRAAESIDALLAEP